MKDSKRRKILVLILCILVGFALRYYAFDRKSLWIDEIHTFNDSRDDIQKQLQYYKENPTYLHPPLFFILTHQFYPFTNPERDLRILPLFFGSLSIPMIYLLAGSFSPGIAIPCTVSLTLLTYHICLSQDGRAYSLTMFLGMVSLYFFMKYLNTSRKRYWILTSILFALLFYTSYSTIPYIALSQILWLYRWGGDRPKPRLSSWLALNGLFLLLCIPWIVFLASNYHGQSMLFPREMIVAPSFLAIVAGILNDWVPSAPLTAVSAILLISFTFFSTNRRNAILLLSLLILPIGGLYFYCRLLSVTHFISSRYFINFLPPFFITLFLAINAIESKLTSLKKLVRLKLFFILFLIGYNLLILPLYYRAEKEDFRGLATYLKSQIRQGDKLFDTELAYTAGILHYFGVFPEGRHHSIPYYGISGSDIEFRKTFTFQNSKYTIYSSGVCCTQYVADGSRLWIIAGDRTARKLRGNSPCVLKGYFDGSFLNFNRFPTDASIYLFLWDPNSPNEKGIEIPIP